MVGEPTEKYFSIADAASALVDSLGLLLSDITRIRHEIKRVVSRDPRFANNKKAQGFEYKRLVDCGEEANALPFWLPEAVIVDEGDDGDVHGVISTLIADSFVALVYCTIHIHKSALLTALTNYLSYLLSYSDHE